MPSQNPILYTTKLSPPGRAVQLVAKIIGLDIDVRFIDLGNGENMTEEFLKMNPQHTVPVLDDNGDILWDSHAIIIYLVEKYAKDDSLYPKEDILKKAKINALLHFDSGVLFSRLRFAVVSCSYTNRFYRP